MILLMSKHQHVLRSWSRGWYYVYTVCKKKREASVKPVDTWKSNWIDVLGVKLMEINSNNLFSRYVSGQIIATSHDLTPNGGLVREIPLFQGNLGWWNIIIWPDVCTLSYTIPFYFAKFAFLHSLPELANDSATCCLGCQQNHVVEMKRIVTNMFKYLKWRYWIFFSAILGLGFPFT